MSDGIRLMQAFLAALFNLATLTALVWSGATTTHTGLAILCWVIAGWTVLSYGFLYALEHNSRKDE